MRRIAPLCVVGALLMAVPALAQTSLLVGSWKENIARSKFNPGPGPRSRTLIWEASPGGLKFTVDQVNADGQTVKNVTMEKLDGTDEPITGGGDQNRTRALKRIDDHKYQDVDKLNGKVTTTRSIVISPDGKTMTVSTTATNAQGQKVSNVEVYEKQ